MNLLPCIALVLLLCSLPGRAAALEEANTQDPLQRIVIQTYGGWGGSFQEVMTRNGGYAAWSEDMSSSATHGSCCTGGEQDLYARDFDAIDRLGLDHLPAVTGDDGNDVGRSVWTFVRRSGARTAHTFLLSDGKEPWELIIGGLAIRGLVSKFTQGVKDDGQNNGQKRYSPSTTLAGRKLDLFPDGLVLDWLEPPPNDQALGHATLLHLDRPDVQIAMLEYGSAAAFRAAEVPDALAAYTAFIGPPARVEEHRSYLLIMPRDDAQEDDARQAMLVFTVAGVEHRLRQRIAYDAPLSALDTPLATLIRVFAIDRRLPRNPAARTDWFFAQMRGLGEPLLSGDELLAVCDEPVTLGADGLPNALECAILPGHRAAFDQLMTSPDLRGECADLLWRVWRIPGYAPTADQLDELRDHADPRIRAIMAERDEAAADPIPIPTP